MMFGAVNRVNNWPASDLFTVEIENPNPIADIPATNPKL
jgi:hypothetical protein